MTKHEDDLAGALKTAIAVADEARDEWDAAPGGAKAGKLLIALSGHLPGYRADIDAIHAALAKATFVALAVNSHDDMLAALKLAQTIIGHPDDAGSKIIADAIAKATQP